MLLTYFQLNKITNPRLNNFEKMNLLKLIRIQNLLMIAFMQIVFRYGFLKDITNNYLSLSDFQFALLVLSTVCIAAAGFIINNIMDQENDEIAKPASRIVGVSISEAKAYNYYVAFNLIGVGIGFYLSNLINKPNFTTIFILIAALLYIYSTSLKYIIIVGNLVVAIILSLSLLIIGMFDLFPAIHEGNQEQMSEVFKILLDYALFAFIINFIREVVKDLEDIDGDKASGVNSIAIALGVSKTTKLLFGLSIGSIILMLYYLNDNLLQFDYVLYYALLFIVGPLLYFTIKVWNAKSKAEFHHLSTVLKIILFFGILSILVISYCLRNA